MPRSATEIPHLAFTHHRIGIHHPALAGERPSPRTPSGVGELRPVLELAGLSDVERQWSLGMGYLEAANLHPTAPPAATYRERALDSLAAAQAMGLRDPLLEVSLARLR